jgi:hypothetical protein
VTEQHIPNLDGLYELGRRDGVDIHPTLLRVTTDLYVAKDKHSFEEERHYTELALRLIELVDPPTRATVAKRLAGYAGAPAVVTQRLAALGAAKPAEITETQSPRRTAADELCEMFFAADAAERRLILQNLGYATLTPAEPLAQPAARESVRRLEQAALAHNSMGFARELERALGIVPSLARRLIADESGEPVVVAAVVLGMPADVLQRVLLCLNPVIGQSVQRVYELANLQQAIEPAAALRLLAVWRGARRTEALVAAATARRSAEPPHAAVDPHQPYYWDVAPNARSPRRTSATPAAPPARPQIRWEEHAQQERKAERG